MTVARRALHKKSPSLARAFLEYFLPTDIREPVIGDFEESFCDLVSRRGHARAAAWYWGQALRSVFACLSGKIGEQCAIVWGRFETAAQILVRHRRYSLTSTIGLTLAFTCCILIALFEAHELSYDKYHKNAERIFRLSTSGGVVFPGPLAGEIRTRIPHVERVARLSVIVAANPSRVENGAATYASDRELFAESEVFEIFDWNLTGKNKEGLLDRPFTVVLNRTLSAAAFGGTSPIGKKIVIDKHDFTVTGVIEDIPSNSSIRPDFIVSFASLESLLTYNNYEQDWLTSWAKGHSVTPIYVLLDDPANQTEVASGIEQLLDENRIAAGYADEAGDDVRLQPLDEIYLGPARDWQVNRNGDPKRLVGMGVAVLLILLVAGINIINLVVAIWQAEVRMTSSRDVETRRFRLFLRLASESFLVTILAVTFGLFAAVLMLPLFSNIVDRELFIQTRLIPWIVLCSVPFALITGAVAAANPEAFFDKKAGRPQSDTVAFREYHRTRHGRLLVAFQFVVAAALVFTAAVMVAQTRFIRSMPLGYDKENLLIVSFQRGAMTPDQFREIKGALLDLPGVESAAASYSVPEGCTGETRLRMWGDGTTLGIPSRLFIADSDFLDTYRVPRLTGADEHVKAPDGWEFWINRTAATALGWKDPAEAVGKNIESTGACDKNWHLVVGGVFEDYHQCPVYHDITPLVICIPPEDTYWHLTLRLDETSGAGAAAAVTDEWKRLRPDVAIEPYFLSSRLIEMGEEEYRAARQIMLLALIILVIACAGLTGLVSYTVYQKEPEILVWLNRGCGRLEVTARVAAGFVLMIVTSVLLAWPVSYVVTNQWLDKFAARVDTGVGFYFLVGGSVVLLGLLVVFVPAAGCSMSSKKPSGSVSEVVCPRLDG